MDKYIRMSGSVLAVSGNANNGANDGAFYVNSNNGSGNRNANIGSQLSYCIYPSVHRHPCLLAKHKATFIAAGSIKANTAKGNSR
jgi:hypothetical protein